MILDSLKNKARYEALHPRFKQVFDFIDSHDVAAMECGRHDIDGDNIFVNVQELDLKERSEARLELHRKYIDIQLLLKGPAEEFGWSEIKDCQQPEADFDEQKDVQFFTDTPQCFYSVAEGQFSILYPEDGHAPMLGSGRVKKCIFKILL
ncbi:MAG: YhcH/YjgK/YiaL family protein [Alistipes sp.]|nr:YhcH/YjgK/YiaL family protein [Alistipes sp.]